MKQSTSKIMNVVKILLVVFAFTLSSNVSAATNAPNASSTTLTASTSFFKFFKKKKKKVRRTRRSYRKHNNCPQVPIDGGLGVLVLGAAAFGVRKLRK